MEGLGLKNNLQPILNWNYFFSQPQYGQNWTSYGVDTR